ncbi:hypothetical protein HMPREF1586_00332 [Gardnerella vaginalis JCP8522]|nr:hypothetical protein HMPREF1586_00332 [Gardnerella vaginalis JCP8522]
MIFKTHRQRRLDSITILINLYIQLVRKMVAAGEPTTTISITLAFTKPLHYKRW